VKYEVGATVTASGFFAPQGRDVGRIPPSVADLDRVAAVDPRFLNMDMETAFVLHFCGGHGFKVGAICVAAANRASNTFARDIVVNIHDAARVAILALSHLKAYNGR
jgi:uridine phosphorylase